MEKRFSKVGAPASLAAGCIWLLIWFHQSATHGLTSLNERRLLLGLTWMDSGKFLVIPFCLLLIGILSLHARTRGPSGLGRAGVWVTGAGLCALIVGTALEFWPFPWGSYALSFDQAGLPQLGGIVQAMASLVFTVGLVMLAIAQVMARVMSVWAAVTLVVGGLTTFFLTPVTWLPAAAWLVLGVVLLRSNAQTPQTGTPA